LREATDLRPAESGTWSDLKILQRFRKRLREHIGQIRNLFLQATKVRLDWQTKGEAVQDWQ
jgi:hypothetical protein